MPMEPFSPKKEYKRTFANGFLHILHYFSFLEIYSKKICDWYEILKNFHHLSLKSATNVIRFVSFWKSLFHFCRKIYCTSVIQTLTEICSCWCFWREEKLLVNDFLVGIEIVFWRIEFKLKFMSHCRIEPVTSLTQKSLAFKLKRLVWGKSFLLLILSLNCEKPYLST